MVDGRIRHRDLREIDRLENHPSTKFHMKEGLEKPTITRVSNYMLVRAVPGLLSSSVVTILFRLELVVGDVITELWMI